MKYEMSLYAEKGFFIYGQSWIGDKIQDLEIWVGVPAPSFTSYGMLKSLKLPKFCKQRLKIQIPNRLTECNSSC